MILHLFDSEEIKYEYQENPSESEYIFLFSHPIKSMYEWSQKYKDKILIFMTGEACSPDFNLFDYAFGYDDISFGDRYVQIHFQALLFYSLPKEKRIDNECLQLKKSFCNFIYSNPNAHPNRDIFFLKLNKYKKVDSLGNHLRNVTHNIGERHSVDYFRETVEQKKPYKFSIAFENALHRGYNTEKIISSMAAYTIPIFWGDADIGKMYNPRSFINCHDYDSFDKVIELIKEIDNNDKMYLEMLAQPWKTKDQEREFEKGKKKFVEQLKYIFSQPYNEAFRKPVGTYNSAYREFLIHNRTFKYKLKQLWQNIHHQVHLAKKFVWHHK